jgi:hypothetical protein
LFRRRGILEPEQAQDLLGWVSRYKEFSSVNEFHRRTPCQGRQGWGLFNVTGCAREGISEVRCYLEALDASIQVEADDRLGLKKLLRYCARPIFSMERLAWVGEDCNRLVYRLPKPMPDGRSQLYLSPLELLD